MKPLNPLLYAELRRRFGSVRVEHAGVGATQTQVKQLRGSVRDELAIPGEYYLVCCPHCGDTRFRLYINHCWGTRMASGRRNFWSIICFNEDCFASWEKRRELWEELLDGQEDLAVARPAPGREAKPEDLQADWPGKVVRVDRLNVDHEAVCYLRRRRFDPSVLGNFYNVHYCLESNRWIVRGRLIIPIYLNKMLVGWQARACYDLQSWKGYAGGPKYYTMPNTPKGLTLYNWANARRFQTLVVVEGAFDVFACGPMACATLGDGLSGHQLRLLIQASKAGQSVILMWDPEALDHPKSDAVIKTLRAEIPQFAVVRLPEGRDPGNTDRSTQRSIIVHQAAEQGVEVSWAQHTPKPRKYVRWPSLV